MTIFAMKADVFSTYVEVILVMLLALKTYQSILHVCGGDPLGFDDSWAKKAVFSTYVEVILTDLVGAVLD